MAPKGTNQDRDTRRGAADSAANRGMPRGVKPHPLPSPSQKSGSDYPDYDKPGSLGSNKSK